MAKRKAKQAHLDGMEPPSIKAIEDAAENYYDTMQERIKLNKEEDTFKDALIDAMKEHGMDRYEYDGKIVMVTSTAGVKVKPVKKAKKDGDEEGDEE